MQPGDQAPYGAYDEAFEPSIFARLFRVAWNNRLLVGVILGLTLAAALVLTLLATPQFTSTARIQINRVEANIADIQGVEPSGDTLLYDEFYRTQYALLESESLAERVSRRLNLQTNEEFLDAFDVPEDGEIVTSNPRRSIEITSDLLLENISVDPVVGSSLVDVSFTSPSRQFSAKVVAAWIEEYISANLERRFEASKDARKFLENQLAELRVRLEDLERQFVLYSSDSGIVSLPTTGGQGAERTLAGIDLAAMNEALVQARSDRLAAESAARAGVQQQSNPVATTLRSERARLAGERAKLLTQFEPSYPAVQSLDSQIAELDSAIDAALGTSQADLQRGLQQAIDRERRLEREVTGYRAAFNEEQRDTVQYNILRREVDTNRELYNSLLQRYKEIGVAGVEESNALLVDSPRIPMEPSSPNLALNLAIGLLLGLGIAGAVVFAKEEMDRTLRDPADVKNRLGLSLLGVIPRLQDGDLYDELADPKSAMFEAYLSVGVMLDMATSHGFPRTVMTSSTVPSEGKTATSYAIASRLAGNGQNTVLVDLDLRNPSVSKRLGIANDHGVVNYLTGEENLDGLIYKEHEEMLSVLSTGPMPPNPGELISGPRVASMLERLLDKYDHVVIDAPPVLGLADAPVLGTRVEGVVFVIEANRAGLRQINSAIGRLRSTGSKIFGAVVTKADDRNTDYGYGSEYGYGYGYGQGTSSADG